jgi:hypothetical protein
MPCSVGSKSEAGAVVASGAGMLSKIGIISAMVVRYCCHIPQN